MWIARLGILCAFCGAASACLRYWLGVDAQTEPTVAAALKQSLGPLPSIYCALGCSGAALLLGIVAFWRNRQRWLPRIALALGVITTGYFGCQVYAALPPRVPLAEMRALQERAQPLIEKWTGRKYTAAVPLKVSSARELEQLKKSSLQSIHDEGLDDGTIGASFTYLALYADHAVQFFPEGLAWIRRAQDLNTEQIDNVLRRTAIHELVHALDDQSGLMGRRDAAKGPQCFLVQRALEEGHAEFISGKVAEELQIPVLAVRGGKPAHSFGARMVSGMFGFLYDDGCAFFEQLDQHGGRELREQVWRQPPPWMHYIRYPQVYLRDRESGALKFYENLAETLAYCPDKAWHVASGAENFDIDLIGFDIDFGTAEWRALMQHRLADWTVQLQRDEPKQRLTSLVMRFDSAAAAAQYAEFSSSTAAKKPGNENFEGQTDGGVKYVLLREPGENPKAEPKRPASATPVHNDPGRWRLYGSAVECSVYVSMSGKELPSLDEAKRVAGDYFAHFAAACIAKSSHP